MQLAISISSLADNTVEALERAADLGFGTVEVSLLDHEFDYGYRRQPNVRFYRHLQTNLDKTRLKVWSVSPPQLRQEQMFSARTRKEILKSAAGAAGFLDAKVFVVQPADIFRSQTAFDQYVHEHKAPAVIDGFDEAWVQVANRRMTMALINRDYWIGTALTNQAQRLANIMNDLAVGCALDVRQAANRTELSTWLEHIGDRLAVGYAYDVSEDGLPIAPDDDEWQSWIPTIKESRLKVIVIKANSSQSDEQIVRSRRFLEGLLSSDGAAKV